MSRGGQMDYEAEYDNRAKVPGSPEIVAGWGRDAAAMRAGHADAELSIAYGEGERERLDVFWPAAGREAPVVLFVHGGYWRSLDRSVFSHLARGLVECGLAVAMPSYDLCPTVTLATIVAQVRAAAAFLARRHGYGQGRGMVTVGHSAGGHLAAMLLATDWAAHGLAPGTVRAALPISGLFDLLPLLQTGINRELRLDEPEARRLSPMALPSPGLPIHAVVGATEGAEYTRQSSGIAAAWGGTWEAVAGADHFSVVEPLTDPGSALVARVVRMVQSA